MKIAVRALGKTLFLLTFVLFAAPVAANSAGELVNAPVAIRKAAGDEIAALKTAHRMRAVGVDRGALERARMRLLAKTTMLPTLDVAVFDDVRLMVEITGGERTHGGGFALVGRVAGDPSSSAVLVDNDGVIYVALVARGERYVIQGTAEQGYVAAHVRPGPAIESAIDSMPAPAEAVAKTGARAKAARETSPAQALLDDGSLIDVMVLYTPAARVAAGGAALIEATIDAQVALTNLAYQNSNVVQRIALVHRAELQHVEGTAYTDVFRSIRYDFELGRKIGLLRDVYRADLVSLWGMYPQVCGLGWRPATEGAAAANYALNLVNQACTGPGSTVFAHELGHNMGLLHDIATSPETSIVTPEGSSTPTTITYAHGYVDATNRFRTIMAYDSCFPAYACTSIPYFSNPALTFDNTAFYASANPAAPLGHATHGNERQALNDTRETIANYRPSLNGVQPSGIVLFMESSVNVNETAGNAVLTVTRIGSAGAVSVNYATTPGTALAGIDYTTTSGTLNWADGDLSTRTITVPIILGPTVEPTKQFTVALSGATGATVGAYSGTGATTSVVIFDNSPDPYPPSGTIPSGFVTTAAAPWTVDSTRGYDSPSSLMSAEAPVGQASELEYTGNFGTGYMTFMYRASMAPSPSRFELLIDGAVVFTRDGGDVDWTQVTQFVSAGTHTIKWRYFNAQDGCYCEGRVWIDDLVMPPPAAAPTSSQIAFIANGGSNDVSVIDLATNAVIATVPVGTGPAGVTAHPDGSRVYVANTASASISVIDTLTQTVVATIPMNTSPQGIAITPDGTRGYVVHYGSSTLGVFDATTDTRLTDIPVTGGGGGVGIVLNLAGTKAYVTYNNNSQFGAFELPSGLQLGMVAGGNKPFGVAVAPDHSKVYVVENQAARLSIRSPVTYLQTTQVNLSGQPIGVAVNAVNRRVYVTLGAGGGGLAVINADTNAIVTTIPVSTSAYGVAVDGTGTRAIVTNSSASSVSVIDTSTNAVIATIPVGNTPRSLGPFIASVTKPSAPRTPAASASNQSASISFTAPAFNGGSAITQYTATCNPGNFTGSAAASPVVVSGLTNGTTYTCSVKATTANGTGPASAGVSTAPLSGTAFTSANAATFTVLATGTFSVTTQGAPTTSITATGALPSGVTLSNAGLLSGTPATGSAGTYPITITAANGTPPDATQAFTLTVAKIAQAITFATPSAHSQADAPFTVSATGGASGNAVTFSSLSASVCTTGGANGTTVTLLTSGTCTIAADQAGTSDYNAAPQTARSFTVRASQVIVPGAAPSLAAGASRTQAATGGGSGNPVTFTSTTTGVCTATGTNGATITGVFNGTCSLTANQAGNANYDAAAPVVITFSVTLGTQVIVVSTAPVPMNVATSRITSAGGSGNPVLLTSLTPSLCTAGGSLITAIEWGTCTVTANQAGNASYLAADPVTFSVRPYSPMPAPRDNHGAVTLQDGRVLVVGGFSQITPFGHMYSSAIYNPVTKAWTASGNLVRHRMLPALALLNDGRVLAVAGQYDDYTPQATAEIYNPATGTWSAAAAPATARDFPTATRLLDGRVLVVGGQANGTTSVEIYNSATNTWSAAASLALKRTGHIAEILADGRVLIAGGTRDNGPGLNTAELYDPVANTWSAAANMARGHKDHKSVRLADGRVLVAGGSTPDSPYVPIPERYDPVTNTWSPTGTLRDYYHNAMTLLSDGRVLITGGAYLGTTNTKLYDPVSNTWNTTAPTIYSRFDHTATLLADGTVLIAGGREGGVTWAHSEIFRIGLTILEATLSEGRINTAYPPIALSTSAAAPPVAFAVTTGVLPAGMALSPAGVLGGTPTEVGTFNFTVTATDATSQADSRAFSLLVTMAPVTVTPSAGANGTITPNFPQSVGYGLTRAFTVTPATGFTANVTGTCGGTLVGTTYTTSAVTADCTVIASFTQVAFAPDAPTIGTATAGPNSGSIAFTPPASNGGLPITSYTATCVNTQNFERTGSATSSPITVTGLLSGYTVTCTVTATNPMGTSPPSAPSNGFIPSVPPVTITVSRTGAALANGSITGTGAAGTINCPGTCSVSVAPGTTVTLTAAVTNGALFSGWNYTGLLCNGQNGLGHGNDELTCSFPAPASSVTILTQFNTAATPPNAPQMLAATAGVESVTLLFQRRTGGGSPFTGVSGTCTPTAGGTPVTVAGATSPLVVTGLTAGVGYTCRVRVINAIGPSAESLASSTVVPLPQSHMLTVVKDGAGVGSVLSDVAGIACGADCTESYVSGTNVTLTATPASGSVFAGWSGAGCSGTAPCTVAMTAAATVTATFVPPPTLSVTKSGTGQGTVSSSPAGIDCGPTCSATYVPGTVVTLTATPQTGSTFAGWSGACSGTGACVVTMDAAKSVTATFTVLTYNLTVAKAGAGAGTVSSAPAGIACGATCTFIYSHGTGITLTATPDGVSTFTGWSGGGCSGTGTCVVTLTAAASVTATFGPQDATAPETTIDTKPPVTTNTASATFTFSGTDAGSGVATFDCKLDAASFAVCTSPVNYPTLAAGVHTFEVRARDVVGNVDATPASFTWTIDTTGPSLAFNAKPTITAANQASYAVGGTCSENGRTVTVQIDSVAASGVCATNAFTTTGVNVTAIAQGTVSLTATLTDEAGNSTSVTDSTTKDTVGPVLGIGTLDVINNANKAAYAFAGTCENGGGVVSYTIAPVTGAVSCVAGGYAATGLNLTPVAEGLVPLSVTQADGAGNSTTTNGSVLKDTVNPLVTIDIAPVVGPSNHTGYAVTGTCSEPGRPVSLNVGGVSASGSCGAPAAGLYSASGLNVSALADGPVTLTASHVDAAGNTGTASTTATKNTAVLIPRLVNISTRGQVLTGSDVMIAGFIIGGSASKTIVAMVSGPSLTAAGVPGALANPTLSIVRASDGATIASNDNWQTQSNPADVAALTAAGFTPQHPLEPAVMMTLPPGAYTAVVQGIGGTGVGLVALYEVDHPEVPLINISTRGQVLTGADVMIAGFVIQGSNTQTVVVTVAGPSMTAQGVPGALQNPTLTIVRATDGAVIAQNDNWQVQTNPADAATIQNAGFSPQHPNEPAVYLTLPPGAYTAIVQGAGGTTGVGLVAVYRVQ